MIAEGAIWNQARAETLVKEVEQGDGEYGL